jgi:mevalonate kinase
VILLGEHVVVYGRPAVASGLPIELEAVALRGDGPALASDADTDPRGVELVAAAARLVGLEPRDWTVQIRSGIPPGQGLGSSAALCVAVLRALAAAAGRRLGTDDEIAHGRTLEGIFHGTPSGIDPAAATIAAPFRFVRGEPPSIESLALGAPVRLVIGLAASARSTGSAVGGLRARREADPARYEAMFDAVAAVVDDGVEALRRGDLVALGRAFDRNQTLLAELGVSSSDVERRVAAARAAGALGAKLTGGGAGGAVIALVDASCRAAVARTLAGSGGRSLDVVLRGRP